MSGELVRLTKGDLRERLEQIFQTPHRSHLVAFHGTGEKDKVETRVGTFEIVPVESELELRTLIPGLDVEDAKIAFLVPYSHRLPLDIGCRFAQDGYIFLLGRAARLKRLFGASEVEGRAATSELARLLLENAGREAYPFPGGRLTFDGLWTTWLGEELGVPVEGGLSLEGLLTWSVTDSRGPAWSARPEAAADSAFLAELVGLLTSRVGVAAPAVFRAWMAGTGRTVLELAILFEALRERNDGAVRMWTTMKAEVALGLRKDDDTDGILASLGEVASAALRRLERAPGGDAIRRTVLAAADGRIDHPDIRRAVAGSRWLPSAWTAGLERLGEVLADGAKAPSPDAVASARALLHDLERHHFFKETGPSRVFERAEMAVRLLAWLVARPDEQRPRGASSYAEVERLARWYADEGGFVDWARRRARGSDEGAFGRGVGAVLAAVDTAREALDQVFARALPAWLAAGKPATHVLPIERAADRLAADFLEERADRKLLVLLIDGMAWAQAVELVLSMPAWGPVGFQGVGRTRGVPTPVLAALPTVTEVSRAAFFAGKVLPAGQDGNTDKDVDRWAAHETLRPFARKGEAPRLLLRAEGHTQAGGASKEALSLVRDEKQRVVAVVINAIDASLKGDSQADHRWTVDSIKSLLDLLDAARESGRTVLLASDHGHIPADRLRGVGTPVDSKARWRPWTSPEEPLKDFEIAIPKAYAWAPPGAHGVVLLVDDSRRYGGAPHAGEHGGASLAEVVAPALLIDTERLPGDGERDPGLEVQPLAPPPWWAFDTRTSSADMHASTSPSGPARRSSSRKMKAVRASAAEVAAPAVAAPTAVTSPGDELAARLAEAPLFAARVLPPARRKDVLRVVAYLADRDGGQATVSALAGALGLLPGRLSGLIAVTGEALNVDGYQVVRIDAGANLVRLDLDKLKQIYGLP